MVIYYCLHGLLSFERNILNPTTARNTKQLLQYVVMLIYLCIFVPSNKQSNNTKTTDMEHNTDHREEAANAKLLILIIVLSFLLFSIGCKSSKPTYKAVTSIGNCQAINK